MSSAPVLPSFSSLTLSSIEALPSELLAHILSFLDTPAPSDTRLHDQPSGSMLSADPAFLKAASLVSKRWRDAALPLLFRNVVCPVDRWDLLLAEQERDPAYAMPWLAFIQANRLSRYVKSLTLLVGDSMNGMYRLREGSGGVGPGAIPLANSDIQERDATYNEDNNWLWDLIFDAVDPLRLTIIASPRMLASLLSRMLFLGDAWSFRMPHHILSLSRKANAVLSNVDRTAESSGSQEASASTFTNPHLAQPSTQAGSSSCAQSRRRVPCNLFTIRPWTSLLLNEGSSIRVYKTYEFFHRKPPSMLGALLGSEEFPNDVPLVPGTVRDLSYVGIFPLSSHFNTLVQNLPRVDRLFVQLVPRNDILSDREEMRHVDPSDLWMERNTSYSYLMRELFETPQSNNWAHLRELESGDAADREAWEMSVQYISMAGRGWYVERDGVFAKRDEDETGDASAAQQNTTNPTGSNPSYQLADTEGDNPVGLLSVAPPFRDHQLL